MVGGTMFRFSIRDVLWLTVVVALAVGWWLQFRESDRLRKQNWMLSVSDEMMRQSLEIVSNSNEAMRKFILSGEGDLALPVFSDDPPAVDIPVRSFAAERQGR